MVFFTFSNSPYLFSEFLLCIGTVTNSCEETKHSYSLPDREVGRGRLYPNRRWSHLLFKWAVVLLDKVYCLRQKLCWWNRPISRTFHQALGGHERPLAGFGPAVDNLENNNMPKPSVALCVFSKVWKVTAPVSIFTSFAVRCSVSRKLEPFSKFLTFTCLGHLEIWFEVLIPFWGGFWTEKRLKYLLSWDLLNILKLHF